MKNVLNLQRIVLSLGVIVFVGAVVVGATGAFFSDTETSSGNTFTAGAIDLGIDNESYYNGVRNEGTSWAISYDLDDGAGPSTGDAYLFFDFKDLKPGDWGEDTIGVTVNNNDAYACAYVKLTEDAEKRTPLHKPPPRSSAFRTSLPHLTVYSTSSLFSWCCTLPGYSLTSGVIIKIRSQHMSEIYGELSSSSPALSWRLV